MSMDGADGDKLALAGKANTRPKDGRLSLVICVAAGFLMFAGTYFVEPLGRSLSLGLVVFVAVGTVLVWSRLARSGSSWRDFVVNVVLAALVSLVVLFVIYAVFNLVRTGG